MLEASDAVALAETISLLLEEAETDIAETVMILAMALGSNLAKRPELHVVVTGRNAKPEGPTTSLAWPAQQRR